MNKMNEEVFTKVPPNSEDAEIAVLGAILIEKDALDKVITMLKPEMFYNYKHKTIYETCLKLTHQGKPIDIYTVSQQIIEEGKNENITPYDVAQLTEHVGSASHIEYHAKIIVEKWIRRVFQTETYGVCKDSGNETVDIVELVERLNKVVDIVTKCVTEDNADKLSNIVGECLKEIEETQTRGTGLSGISTGFSSLDNHFGGWVNGNLIVVAARPAMGKTAFVVTMATNMALRGVKCLLLTLEMKKTEIGKRIISYLSNVSSSNMRNGYISNADWSNIENAIGRIEGFDGQPELPIVIDDSMDVNTLTFKAKVSNLIKKYGSQVIIVDYIGLMQGSKMSRNQSKNIEIGEITRTLKKTAMDLNVPIIACCQLNREVEKRTDKKPTLADLRDSGSIEQDADIVCFIHRPEEYGIDITEEGESTDRLALLVVGKFRNGGIGDLKLKFNKETTSFTEWG